MNKKLKQTIILALFIIVPLLVGYLSAQLAGVSFKSAYAHLKQPSFAPAASVFFPVWTVLYTLMGISAYLVWKKEDQQNIKKSTVAYITQLVLNFFWSIIFFGMGNYLLALIEIILLLVAILFTIIYFNKTSKLAACLLVPYFYWVGFATILNFAIFKLN